jgi:hypothetical protein
VFDPGRFEPVHDGGGVLPVDAHGPALAAPDQHAAAQPAPRRVVVEGKRAELAHGELHPGGVDQV